MKRTSTSFNEISLFDSYLLGWEQKDQTLILYLEAWITDIHPWYTKDRSDLFANLKLCIIEFKQISKLTGIDENPVQLPKWTKLEEYDDLMEIDDVEQFGNSLKLVGDEGAIYIEYESFSIEILEGNQFLN